MIVNFLLTVVLGLLAIYALLFIVTHLWAWMTILCLGAGWIIGTYLKALWGDL